MWPDSTGALPAFEARLSDVSWMSPVSDVTGQRSAATWVLLGVSFHNATSLSNDEFLICRLRSQFVDLPAGPANDNCIDPGRRSQAEMDARVARTFEAAPGANFGIAG